MHIALSNIYCLCPRLPNQHIKNPSTRYHVQYLSCCHDYEGIYCIITLLL